MDSIALPIELDKTKIDGRFRLVNIIAQRAKELAHSGTPKVHTKAKKVTTIALEEALRYSLDFITGEEAKQANEEAKKLDYKKFLEEKRRESEQEDLSELEKDLKFYLDEKEESSKVQSIESIFGSGAETSSEADSDADGDMDLNVYTDAEHDVDSPDVDSPDADSYDYEDREPDLDPDLDE